MPQFDLYGNPIPDVPPLEMCPDCWMMVPKHDTTPGALCPKCHPASQLTGVAWEDWIRVNVPPTPPPPTWTDTQLAMARYLMSITNLSDTRNAADLGGCEVCMAGGPSTDRIWNGQRRRWETMNVAERHYASLKHISAVLQLDTGVVSTAQPLDKQILALLEYVDSEEVLAKPRPEVLQGWRGFNVVMTTTGPRLRGVNPQGGVIWQESVIHADCHGDRELCIQHITHRGSRSKRTPSIAYGQLILGGSPAGTRDNCLCGVYSYSGLEPHLLTASDNFMVFTLTVAWGVASVDEDDNFKASDMRLTRGFVIQDRLGKLDARFDQTWKGTVFDKYFTPQTGATELLAQDLEAHYGIPFDAVATAKEVKEIINRENEEQRHREEFDSWLHLPVLPS